MRKILPLILGSVFIFTASIGHSQNPFAHAAQVDEAIITEFEIAQRSRFMQLLNAPGSDRSSVLDELIADRLRLAAARQLGITLADAELQRGLSEFAGRADLTAEEFVSRLEQVGVARETFRDFVAVRLIWRDYIRARFGAQVQISEAEIDRAIASSGTEGGIEVLISEIIIPAPPEGAAEARQIADRAAQAQSPAEFSRFARQYSATAARDNGGRLDWLPISQLPPSLRQIILTLSPGEVTDPLPLPNAVALFQLRDIRETSRAEPEYAAIEYAAYYMAGGRSDDTLREARLLERRVDRCDDLYGVAQGQDPSVLDRGSLAPEDIPQDIAIELAKLDPGEISTALTRADGQTLVFLMLCGRTAAIAAAEGTETGNEIDRAAIATELRNERLSAFADNLVQELRSQANIRIFN